MKKRYPFRLGTTSYILPADIMTNVKYLASKVDDIELLVFESDEMAELPDVAMINELATIADHEGLTYTVHLPLDLWLGDFEPGERARSVLKCVRTIEAMQSLNPKGWVLHCNRGGSGNNRIERDMVWVAAVEDSIENVVRCGVEKRMLCVETLDASFTLLAPLIKENGLSICLDVGHLVLYGLPFKTYVGEYLDNAPIVHLHGVRSGKDHRDIGGIGATALETLFSGLTADANKDRVVTLEVFNEEDFKTSLPIMERYCL